VKKKITTERGKKKGPPFFGAKFASIAGDIEGPGRRVPKVGRNEERTARELGGGARGPHGEKTPLKKNKSLKKWGLMFRKVKTKKGGKLKKGAEENQTRFVGQKDATSKK